MKKIIFSGLVISMGLFMASCSSNDNNLPEPELTPEEILDLPYSQLSPQEQKAKLENEAIEFLKMANELKSKTAINALNNLNRLMSPSEEEEVSAKSTRATLAEDVFRYSSLFEIRTWNTTKQDWDITESTDALKIIFPATESSQTNNATLEISAVESDNYLGNVPLPSTGVAILTIDNKPMAQINLSAEYNNSKVVPAKAAIDIVYGNYTMAFDFKKATENNLTATLNHNKDLMLYAEAGFTLDPDKVIEGEFTGYGAIKLYLQLMKSLAFYGTINIDNITKAMNEDEMPEMDLDEIVEYLTQLLNDNITCVLASISDRTKIAKLEIKVEGGEHGILFTPYLRFNDNTEAEANAYFSEGFDTFLSELMSFIAYFGN